MNPPDFRRGWRILKWYIFWRLSFFEILGGAVYNSKRFDENFIFTQNIPIIFFL